MKGPDFPTGGQILNSADEIKEIYKTGNGSIRLRGDWEMGPANRGGQTIFITSIPYMVNKSALVERIGEIVESRKLPPLRRRQGRLDRRRADRADDQEATPTRSW